MISLNLKDQQELLLNSHEIKKMQIAVWDTYVTKSSESIMHFDNIIPMELKDTVVIHNFRNESLKTKNQQGHPLISIVCKFCDLETVKSRWETEIGEKDYAIYDMKNCNQ